MTTNRLVAAIIEYISFDLLLSMNLFVLVWHNSSLPSSASIKWESFCAWTLNTVLFHSPTCVHVYGEWVRLWPWSWLWASVCADFYHSFNVHHLSHYCIKRFHFEQNDVAIVIVAVCCFFLHSTENLLPSSTRTNIDFNSYASIKRFKPRVAFSFFCV